MRNVSFLWLIFATVTLLSYRNIIYNKDHICAFLNQLFIMIVLFNINPTGMAGLGAGLTSMIQNCSDPDRLELVFLSSELSENDKRNLNSLLDDLSFSGESRIIDYDAKERFGHLISFHGDYTTYGKSLIPTLLPKDRVLYVDSDLLFNTDVLELSDFDTGGHPISAVSTTTVGVTWDSGLLVGKMNIARDEDYFNAGVLLFDCPAYIRQNFSDRWKEICQLYPKQFSSADQTIFNAMCRGTFGRLPRKFNVGWTPKKLLDVNQLGDEIIHFLGSPKPWDLLGRKIHPGFLMWRNYTPQKWFDTYCAPSFRSLKRGWHIRRSLVKYLFKQ